MPYAVNGDVRIYYQVHGAGGPALVFAHGGGGNAASWWQQIPAFLSDHKVVVFDHRGFARSSCPVEAQNPSLFDGDLMAVMDAAEIRRATLVCQSMGGWTGARAAVYHPDRIRAVFLANTPGAVGTPATWDNMKTLQARLRQSGLVDVAISQAFVDGNPAGAFLYHQISACNTNARPNMLEKASYVTPGDIEACGIPFRILASEWDPVFPAALLEGVARDIGASYAYIPSAGHSTYFERPEAFNAALRAFLAD